MALTNQLKDFVQAYTEITDDKIGHRQAKRKIKIAKKLLHLNGGEKETTFRFRLEEQFKYRGRRKVLWVGEANQHKKRNLKYSTRSYI